MKLAVQPHVAPVGPGRLPSQRLVYLCQRCKSDAPRRRVWKPAHDAFGCHQLQREPDSPQLGDRLRGGGTDVVAMPRDGIDETLAPKTRQRFPHRRDRNAKAFREVGREQAGGRR